jgi:5-methylcytosine-specific restriction endonuclease McrA
VPYSRVYVRYLASKTWAARRARYFRTHEKMCRACGARSGPRRAIHLHHLTYERLGKERNADLLPLCKTCHLAVHDFHRANRHRYDLAKATELVVRRKRRTR